MKISDKFVTSPKILDKNKKFHPQGIFSEQIFGPVVSYRCQCEPPRYNRSGICPECGVEFKSSSSRRETFAKIKLPVKILSIPASILLSSNMTDLYNAFKGGKGFKVENGKIFVSEFTYYDEIEFEKKLEYKYGIEGLIYVIKEYYEQNNGKVNDTMEKLYEMHKENTLTTDEVVVLPPDYRKIASDDMVGKINSAYIVILNLIEQEKYVTLTHQFAQIRKEISYQKAVDNLVEEIIKELKGKEGVLRSLASKRLDWSGRAVIVPKITDIDTIYLPRKMALEIFKLDIASKLREKYQKFSSLSHYYLIKIITSIIKEDSKEKEYIKIYEEVESVLDEVLNDILEEKIVLSNGKEYYVNTFILNRQPTLHRGSFFNVRAKVWNENTIGISHIICEPFNADFDGDTMAIYRVPKSAIVEAKNMSPYSAYINPRNLKNHFVVKQDILYTVYKATKNPILKKYVLDKLGIKEDIEITKDTIPMLVDKYGLDILNKILEISSVLILSNPITMSIHDFYLGSESEVEYTDDYIENLNRIDKVKEKIKTLFSKHDIIDSGARGSYEQLMQIVSTRGYIANASGEVERIPVKNSYLKGLTVEEYYISSKGTRKSLIDKSVYTISKSGYLYRKIYFASMNALLDYSKKDCGSTDYLEIEVKNEKIFNSIIGRYMLTDDGKLKQITDKDKKNLIGKIVKVRSPIFCKHHNGYCRTCYPYDFNSRFIGIIAAQSISERISQLSMREFHTGGIARGDITKGKNDDMMAKLNVIDSYFSSSDEDTLDNVVNQMKTLAYNFINNTDVMFIHFEVVESERYYIENENGELVKFRLNKDLYNSDKIKRLSVKQIPSMYLYGILFENPKKMFTKILLGKIKDTDETVLDKLILGQKVV